MKSVELCAPWIVKSSRRIQGGYYGNIHDEQKTLLVLFLKVSFFSPSTQKLFLLCLTSQSDCLEVKKKDCLLNVYSVALTTYTSWYWLNYLADVSSQGLCHGVNKFWIFAAIYVCKNVLTGCLERCSKCWSGRVFHPSYFLWYCVTKSWGSFFLSYKKSAL